MNSIATTIFKVSVCIQFGKYSIIVTIIFKASSVVKNSLFLCLVQKSTSHLHGKWTWKLKNSTTVKRLSSGQFTRKMMPTWTDFYNWYHPQWNSEDKKCENLLIARVRVSCQQKQWRNFVWVDDFLLLLGAGYLPVRVICWNFFLAIAKIDRCG